VSNGEMRALQREAAGLARAARRSESWWAMRALLSCICPCC